VLAERNDMKLSRLIARVKVECPNIGTINDDEITAILNEGCDDINARIKIYKTYTDFNIVAEQQTYELSLVIPNYLCMDKKSVFLQDDSGNWQIVYPKTKDWISQVYPNWMNASSGFPKWYWLEGDEIGFHNKPDTSVTNGGRVFHLKKRVDMSNNDHYPWIGSTRELTAFRPADGALIAYAKWKLSPAVGAVTDADLRYREYLGECRKAAKQIKGRPDISTDTSFSVKI